jgi:hypothetical protein
LFLKFPFIDFTPFRMFKVRNLAQELWISLCFLIILHSLPLQSKS